MSRILCCGDRLASHVRIVRSARTRLVMTCSGSHDDPSTSGRDLSCSGGPVGFGTLRKGFKPQPQRTKQNPPTSNILLNGRDKADVLRDTNAEIASRSISSISAVSQGEGEEDMWADWKRVDAKVNTYPCERLFTAVGSGGEDFKMAMVAAVEEVVGGPAEVTTRASSGGAYLSVRVGPVTVHHRDQVLAIFTRMRQDKRLKFHL